MHCYWLLKQIVHTVTIRLYTIIKALYFSQETARFTNEDADSLLREKVNTLKSK
jgi:hypothetical protein